MKWNVPRLAASLALSLLGLVAVLLLPAYLQFREPVWSIPQPHDLHVYGFAVCYVLCQAVAIAATRRLGALRLSPIAAVLAPLLFTGSLLGLLFLGLLLVGDATYSRALLIMETTLIFGVIGFQLLLDLGWHKVSRALPLVVGVLVLLVGAGVVGAALIGGYGAQLWGGSPDPSPSSDYRALHTSHQTVEAGFHYGFIPPPRATGGAVHFHDGAYLLVTGDGIFYRIAWEDSALAPTVRELPLRAPINAEEFDREADPSARREWFRVADFLIDEPSVGGSRLFVSHHVWHGDRGCFALRLSVTDLPAGFGVAESGMATGSSSGASRVSADFAEADTARLDVDEWSTVYETRPCLPIRSERTNPFDGLQAGGRLARLEDGRLLMTIGDHKFDGWNSERVHPQDSSSDYGKTLALNPREGTADIFTSGHRNAQGLFVGQDGRLWSAEHGPEGGDELNLLVPGGNYGWPYVTEGTNYGDNVWPLDPPEDVATDDFRQPVYAWVPSVGISSLIKVHSDELTPSWRGDLLVGSLDGRSLYRARREEGRILYVEPIDIGEEIRDLTEGPDGRIVLWTDAAVIVALTPPNAVEEGAVVFGRCIGCHKSSSEGTGGAGGPGAGGRGDTGPMGPSLDGIYGRDVAAAPGYEYSEALERVGGRWNERRLHAFLAAPDSFAPGTRMQVEGIPDSTRRAALIDYLKRLGTAEP